MSMIPFFISDECPQLEEDPKNEFVKVKKTGLKKKYFGNYGCQPKKKKYNCNYFT